MTIFPGTAANELRDLIRSKIDPALTMDQQADVIARLFIHVDDMWESRETTTMSELPGRSYLDTRLLVAHVPRETKPRSVRINRTVEQPDAPAMNVRERMQSWEPGTVPTKLQYDAATIYLEINRNAPRSTLPFLPFGELAKSIISARS